MRRALSFTCAGAELAATIDPGARRTGLLIVSGGNEVRAGAQRGMARLATDMASRGWPVFRFDRRGVGDSEGENGGFISNGPDIEAAAVTFRLTCPDLSRVVAFGNCDAATALVVHRGDAAIDALVLANPWVVEPVDELPPVAAIRNRYARRLRDPEAWAALLTGKIDMRKLAKGLGRIATPISKGASLADQFASAFDQKPLPTTILLAQHDTTAVAFDEALRGRSFAGIRHRIAVERIDSNSHSFASDSDYNVLVATLTLTLEKIDMVF